MSACIALLLLLACVQVQAELPPTLKFLSNYTNYQQPRLPPSLKYLSNFTNGQQAVNTRGHREIAYEVRLKTDTKYSDNEILKFDDIVCNKGNAYTKGSGLFIAPVTGAYLLWAHIERKDYYPMTVDIKSSKSVVLLRGYVGRNYYYGLGAASIVGLVHLNKGEHIWVTKVGKRQNVLKGDLYSSYGGSLLAFH